jgi:ADP-ribosyl-[dinitrogen reductase] hydrolase
MKGIGTHERFQGALLGLAAGDALGTTLEFKPPGSFEPITDMAGGGPFGLKPGEWTDDTSMALCLAASLTERNGFDPRDQMERYCGWRHEGYMSSTGQCFDIGNATAGALRRFESTGEPFSGSTSPQTAGNGSLMRLAPVPLFFARDPVLAIQRSGDSSRTTHGTATCVDACRYFGALLVGAVSGVPKDMLLSAHYSPVPDSWDRHPLHSEIAAIAEGSFKRRNPPDIRGTGYVVQSLEAALWAFWNSDDFRDGCLKAVNLGDDADTTGAVYGQIAGAYYGESGIPKEWLQKLALRSTIESLADRLRQLAFTEGPLSGASVPAVSDQLDLPGDTASPLASADQLNSLAANRKRNPK